jgi:hypothetical protein
MEIERIKNRNGKRKKEGGLVLIAAVVGCNFSSS